jgi:hypothetical protein
MASQQPPKKEYTPWQPSQTPPQPIAGGGFKLPQMPSNLGLKFQDAFQNKANNLAGMFINQGNPTTMAEEAKATSQYGMVDPNAKYTPEDLAVLNQVRGNQLPNEKRDMVNALRKNQGAGTALKLGLAGAGLAYVLSGGDMGKVALGGLAGAGAGSLLNRKTALQKLEDYTNMKEANTLNQGYANTLKQQAFDEGATVDSLAMAGTLTKDQSLAMKKIVARMQDPNISREEYTRLEAMLQKMEAVPMENAQTNNALKALQGKGARIGKPTDGKVTKQGKVIKNKDGSFSTGVSVKKAQFKDLGTGGLKPTDVAAFKRGITEFDTSVGQENKRIAQSDRQQQRSLAQDTAKSLRGENLERDKFDYNNISRQIDIAQKEKESITKPDLKAPIEQVNAYNARVALKQKHIDKLESKLARLGVNK